MLSKEAARAKIATSENPITLHVDGTTKKRKGYTTFLASTDEGTVGMSLHDVSTESADSLLKDAEDTLNELMTLSISEDKDQVLHLLARVNIYHGRPLHNKQSIY